MGYSEWLHFATAPRHIGINLGFGPVEIPACFIIHGASSTALFVGNVPNDVRWHLLYENDNERQQ